MKMSTKCSANGHGRRDATVRSAGDAALRAALRSRGVQDSRGEQEMEGRGLSEGAEVAVASDEGKVGVEEELGD